METFKMVIMILGGVATFTTLWLTMMSYMMDENIANESHSQ